MALPGAVLPFGQPPTVAGAEGLVASPEGQPPFEEVAWQSQSRQLENIAVELHQAQGHLLRQQVSVLAGGLTAMRQEFAALQASQQESHANLNAAFDSRVKELDGRFGALGDLCSRHGRDHEVAKKQIEQLHNRLLACEKHGVDLSNLHSTVDALAQHKATLDSKHASLSERIGHLSNSINFVAENHDKQVEVMNAHKASHMQVCSDVMKLSERLAETEKAVRDATTSHAHLIATAHTKIDSFQRRVSEEHAAQHAITLEEVRNAHAALIADKNQLADRHSKTELQVACLEELASTTAKEHLKHLQSTQSSLQSIHSQVASQVNDLKSHHSTMDDRVNRLESHVGEAVRRHASEIDVTTKKIKDIDGRIQVEMDARGRRDVTVEGRVRNLEQSLKDVAKKNDQYLKDSESSQRHLQGVLSSYREEKDTANARHASLDQRLKGIESSVSDLTSEHARQMQAAKKELQSLNARIGEEKACNDSDRMALKERMAGLEASLGRSGARRMLGASSESMHLERSWVDTGSTMATGPDSPKFATTPAQPAEAAQPAPLGRDPPPPRLGAADSSLAVLPNRDYFRRVTSLILAKDDGPRRGPPRVTSLPSLIAPTGGAATC